MKLILIGPPGAGKGTQGELLSQHFQIPKISTGDILRAEIKNQTEAGKEVEKLMSEGKFASDELIIDIVKNRVLEKDCENGYILDGCPRTLAQAEAIEKAKIAIDYVVNFEVPSEQLLERLTGRRIHLDSGRVYHVVYNPPKEEGIDDITSEALTQRADDTREVVAERLKQYDDLTMPVVNFYKNNDISSVKFINIDANKGVEDIQKLLLNSLK